LEDEGYFVLYSDRVAQDIIATDPEVKAELIEKFGEEIFEGNEINKELVRALIFGKDNSDENRNAINALVHPYVLESNFSSIEGYLENPDNEKDIVFVESALAFESGMAEGCDYVVQVSVDEDVSDKRLLESRGLSQETIDSIRNSQLSQQEKERLADFTITNNDGIEKLKSSTMFILELLKSMPPRFGRPETEEDVE
jgi:dephospho-CoA kinase